MVIKASSGTTVDKLIADLSSGNETARDAAIARLTIIGSRATQRLLTLARDLGAPVDARVAAFRALDAIGEPRSLDAALVALGDSHSAVAAAATAVARAFLHTERGLAALDRLSETAMDASRPSVVRVASIQALVALGSTTVEPLLDTLRRDADAAVVAAASGHTVGPAPTQFESARALIAAAGDALPHDAILLRQQIAAAGGTIPVTVLHQIVERVRVREGGESSAARPVWIAARAAAHALLAQRGSRLALYDLRETIESAKGPIAVDFLTALKAIGDVNCIEPVATAFATAAAAEPTREDWWRRGLADVFRAIVARESLTRRHAVIKKIEKKYPGLFEAVTAPIRA